MAYKIIVDCTTDLSISNFLNSEKCSDIGINAVQLSSTENLSESLIEYKPAAVVLSTNVTSINDMYAFITGNVGGYNYILCVGETRNKKDKSKLKLLQEEYNCYIIENVVTDFLLLNNIIHCMGDFHIDVPAKEVLYELDIPTTPVGAPVPEYAEEHVPLLSDNIESEGYTDFEEQQNQSEERSNASNYEEYTTDEEVKSSVREKEDEDDDFAFD